MIIIIIKTPTGSTVGEALSWGRSNPDNSSISVSEHCEDDKIVAVNEFLGFADACNIHSNLSRVCSYKKAKIHEIFANEKAREGKEINLSSIENMILFFLSFGTSNT